MQPAIQLGIIAISFSITSKRKTRNRLNLRAISSHERMSNILGRLSESLLGRIRTNYYLFFSLSHFVAFLIKPELHPILRDIETIHQISCIIHRLSNSKILVARDFIDFFLRLSFQGRMLTIMALYSADFLNLVVRNIDRYDLVLFARNSGCNSTT